MDDSQFYGKKILITLSEPYQTTPSEKIQCIELEGAKRSVIIILCVYMPANGSKNQVEYQECIDELHEIYLKYDHTHDIIIGGDINEDLNKHKPNNTRKVYLINFINEFGCNTKM